MKVNSNIVHDDRSSFRHENMLLQVLETLDVVEAQVQEEMAFQGIGCSDDGSHEMHQKGMRQPELN